MLSFLIPYLRLLKQKFPLIYSAFDGVVGVFVTKWMGTYPRVMGDEIGAVSAVLRGSGWNMAYGQGLVHERLEEKFANYIGAKNAVAVNTGGMALQMSIRALGLKPGDEVVLQVDTCSATAFAVLNAGCIPKFSDISDQSFMLSIEGLDEVVTQNTKAIIATHMWGNPERMDAILEYCKKRDIAMIEDACLALGSRTSLGMAGIGGNVGVFSFGCLKPIQGGEGGMIVTDDDSLAREMRSLRHWGDRTIEYGVRDTTQLAWNGRMSEIVAAVVAEQLKAYPRHLSLLREAVSEFQHFLHRFDGLELVLGGEGNLRDCAFTQIVLKIDEVKLGLTKNEFRKGLDRRGLATWHGNFELINSLSFFRDNHWQDWIHKGDTASAQLNYQGSFPVAQGVFESMGVGVPKINYLSKTRLKNLMRDVESLMMKRY